MHVNTLCLCPGKSNNKQRFQQLLEDWEGFQCKNTHKRSDKGMLRVDFFHAMLMMITCCLVCFLKAEHYPVRVLLLKETHNITPGVLDLIFTS